MLQLMVSLVIWVSDQYPLSYFIEFIDVIDFIKKAEGDSM